MRDAHGRDGRSCGWLLVLPAVALALAGSTGDTGTASTVASRTASAPAVSGPGTVWRPSISAATAVRGQAPFATADNATEVDSRRPTRTAPSSKVRAGAARPATRANVPVRAAGLPDPMRSRGTVPERVAIDGVGISLPVRPVGVEDDGSMELPRTVSRAGWYEFGARPADAQGTTVLAAHVDTRREGLGPFARLREAKEGSTITVADRSGDEHIYRVVDLMRVPKSRAPLDQVFDRSGPARLAVLTCGGAYDQDSGYRDNVIVLAEKT